jgi:putative transposase
MDESESDVLAYMTFSPQHGTKLRRHGAILLEQNDEWSIQRARYITLEAISGLGDDSLVNLPGVVALS